MVIADLYNMFTITLKGNIEKSPIKITSTNVRITRVGDKHVRNSTIHSEQKDLYDKQLTLGGFVSIASGCKFILSGNHDWKRTTTYLNPWNSPDIDGLSSNGGITIGSDVWIGMDCTVMSGVTIGTGAVVAAGSLVSRDVEPYTIVGGVPSKPIKKRFSKEICDRLLKSEWWELPDNILEEHQNLLFSHNIEEFLDKIENI